MNDREARLQRLSEHPDTHEFAKRRARLTLWFPLLLGGVFFSVVLAAGFARPLFGLAFPGNWAAVGTVIAVLFLVLCVVLNAVYMRLYRGRLESLREKILRETEQ